MSDEFENVTEFKAISYGQGTAGAKVLNEEVNELLKKGWVIARMSLSGPEQQYQLATVMMVKYGEGKKKEEGGTSCERS